MFTIIQFYNNGINYFFWRIEKIYFILQSSWTELGERASKLQMTERQFNFKILMHRWIFCREAIIQIHTQITFVIHITGSFFIWLGAHDLWAPSVRMVKAFDCWSVSSCSRLCLSEWIYASVTLGEGDCSHINLSLVTKVYSGVCRFSKILLSRLQK